MFKNIRLVGALFTLLFVGLTSPAFCQEDESSSTPPPAVEAVDLSAFFQSLPGRWVGDGRIYTKGGETENVKCRVTYFLSDDKVSLRQNIRCASQGGKIEIKSLLKRDGETVSGTWHETIYELDGDMSGQAIRNGLKVDVKGPNMSATMQVAIIKGKQIAEVQFNHSVLVGMTLILKRG